MNILKKFFIAIVAFILLLLAAEGVTRIFFHPTDYLWRRLKSDEILRYAVEPNTRGHDSWGFRNKTVPERASVVAIGDSQTYGTSSLAKHTWPKLLGELKGEEVYNMSLGGYGPAEYLYLMQNKALELDPDIIVIGFSLGNDLTDTYEAVYSIPHWETLREPEIASLHEKKSGQNDIQPVDQNHNVSLMTRIYLIADWFSGNSVLYRLANTSSLGDYIRQKRIIGSGVNVVMFEDDESGIYTGFMPDLWLDKVDLDNPEVSEGLRLSLEIISQMNKLADREGKDFLVVIIPTKESVYSEFIEGNGDLQSSEKIDTVIQNERQINDIVKSYFDMNGISYIDVLEPLQNAEKLEGLYPDNYSTHLTKSGNRVIAESIKQRLDGNQQNQ